MRSFVKLRNLLGSLGAVALLALGSAAWAADDQAPELSAEDKACLECHAKPGLKKALPGGEKHSLYVAPRTFAASVHGDSGCEACHAEIDLDTHGKGGEPAAARTRDEDLALNAACRDCHKKTFKQYDDSVHAALVSQGSEQAPLCADCHDPHTVQPAKAAASHGEPVACSKCHDGVVKAYDQSMHAQAGDEALQCKDCHSTHSVKAASLGERMKGECLSCHGDVASTHRTWLPNTDRHLEAISCPACHSPGAQRRVNLRFYDGATQRQESQNVGVPQFVKLARAADADGDGLDGRALWSLLQEFSRNGGGDGKTVLRGRLEVRTGAEAHRLGPKAQALSDCDTCHRRGAASFQSVTVTMAGPDGRPLRHEAKLGVLNSVESIEAVGGFYAIGSTRIALLDVLLVLTLAAGIGVPLGHLGVKLLSRRWRRPAQAAPADGADEPRTPS
jgi:nitrate/TMAO reductase-like tetraheme cytochrome c subunit